MKQVRNMIHPVLFACAAIASAPALAVDGVVLINHSTAIAGNAAIGDAPGYPIQIRRGGSYRLSGSLLMSGEYHGMQAISIEAGDVTLDLNGFEIQGGYSCSGTPTRCTGPTSGAGAPLIQVSGGTYSNIAIRNGSITGAGGHGIDAASGRAMTLSDLHIRNSSYACVQLQDGAMERVHIDRCGWYGVQSGVGHVSIRDSQILRTYYPAIVFNGSGQVTGSTIAENVSGITARDSSASKASVLIQGNTLINNGNAGVYASRANVIDNVFRGGETAILLEDGVVSGNFVSGMSSYAVSTTATSQLLLSGNQFVDNTLGDIERRGTIVHSTPSLCSGVPCP